MTKDQLDFWVSIAAILISLLSIWITIHNNREDKN